MSLRDKLSSLIHFELLNHNHILNTNFCSQQLKNVHENLRKYPALVNRRNLVLVHNNAMTHSARITLEKILYLAWSILPHPPYLPYFLQNPSNDKRFSLKIGWKYLWKPYCTQDPLKFSCVEPIIYLMNGKRWFKIIVNILLVEIKFIIKLSMNKLYFSKNEDSLIGFYFIYLINPFAMGQM